MKKHVIHFAALCLCAAAHVQAAPNTPVVLSKPDLATNVNQVSDSIDGTICIAGDSMDPGGDLQSRGVVSVCSTASNRVLWRQELAAPDDNANIRFVACRVHGQDVYVAANVDTHSQPNLNQSLVWIYRFGPGGKLLAKREIITNDFSSFAYDIDADDDGVTITGRTAGRGEESQANSVFFARLDLELKTESISKLGSGAYVDDPTVHLRGNTATMGGNFAPAHAAADVVADDYAVSKIVAGKYRFSVRPQTGKAEHIATGISSDGEIVSLGHAAGQTRLTVVGPDGKVKDDKQFASAFCTTRSVSADSAAVYAVRSACDDSEAPARLVVINRKTRAEAPVRGIAGVPQYVLALPDRLIVISEKSNCSLLLQAVVKGQ